MSERKILKRKTFGQYGDPTGYEETLYQNSKGMYFMYTYGGSQSPYPSEKVSRVSKEKALAWLNA